MRLISFTQIGLLIDGADPHYFEEAFHSFLIDRVSQFQELRVHTGNAEKRPSEMDSIHFPHQLQVQGAFRRRLIIKAAFTQAAQR